MVVKLKAPSIHAINIVKYIGEHQGLTLVAGDICREINLTQSYFMRLVKDLRYAGILDSVQGRYGGFILRRPLHEISLYEIVKTMEGKDEEEANLDVDSRKLVEVMEELNQHMTDVLTRTTLDQL